MQDTAPDGSGAAAVETTQGQAPAQEVLNLDSHSQWKYQDQTYTPDSWGQLVNEHKEWQGQVSEYKEAQRFVDNFEIDLEKVLNDPSLVSRFKQVYPQKLYHGIVDRLLNNPRQAPAQANTAQATLPKEFLNEFNQIKGVVQTFAQESAQAKEAAAAAHLDAMLPKVLTKYPLASEIEVLTRAEALLNGKQKVTDATFERLARESHETQSKRSDQYYGTKLKTQMEKGAKGRDTGPGGGTPGHAPVKPRTFDEAREAMLKAVGARQ